MDGLDRYLRMVGGKILITQDDYHHLDVKDEGLHLNSTESPRVRGAAGQGIEAGPRRTR